MPKTFYTESDIEALARNGVTSLVINDDVVLTDWAYEKAAKLGIQLINEHDQPPCAPERPYIASAEAQTPATAPVRPYLAEQPVDYTPNAPERPYIVGEAQEVLQPVRPYLATTQHSQPKPPARPHYPSESEDQLRHAPLRPYLTYPPGDPTRDPNLPMRPYLAGSEDELPLAPIRPYLANVPLPEAEALATSEASPTTAPQSAPAMQSQPDIPAKTQGLADRIQQAVIARLGDSIEPALLERIIQRVVKQIT